MKDFSYVKEQEQKSHKKKWYMLDLGKYSCFVLLAPLVPFVWVYDKWKEYLWESCKWSDKKATKVLDYVLPHFLDYDEQKDEYYYCNKWGHVGWQFAKHVPVGLKTFTRRFTKEIKDYLFNEYQKDRYDKRIEKVDMFNGEIFVIFKRFNNDGGMN